MPRDDFLIALNEREFIVKALQEEELRVDGTKTPKPHVLFISKLIRLLMKS